MRCFFLAPCFNWPWPWWWPWWWYPFWVFFHLAIIFLAKGKISKSVSLFPSHIEPKWRLLIRLQDFKSNISLEQSNEIFYFFTCWYQKLRVDWKILGWVWPEMIVSILVTRWMDEQMNEWSWFFMLMQIQENQES